MIGWDFFMKKTKVGIIGCGNISGIYLSNCKNVFKNLEIVACADIDLERAREKAVEFDVPKACTVAELLSDPEIEIVLNLTIPKVHAQISEAVLDAGKSVYLEKPLSVTLEDGRKILEKAKAKGLFVGCAPDTFMGGGIQTCRKLIDDGWIGQPIASTSFMLCHGPESWHPYPETFYQIGAGPMFDMGPYYLTALVNLIGPVKRVTGSNRITFPERVITSAPKNGSIIKVKVPTHVAGIMEFESGAVGTLITSFDVWSTELPNIEIYGTEGTLIVPDPNSFGGSVRIRRKDDNKWTEMPLTHGYIENSRGIGLSDMANAIAEGKQHRANGELALHVLELMHGFQIAASEGKHYDIECKCLRPDALR